MPGERETARNGCPTFPGETLVLKGTVVGCVFQFETGEPGWRREAVRIVELSLR